MVLCSTNFQLCGPLPASGSFTVKLWLPKALNVTEKYFDTWQGLILKTCLLKKVPIMLLLRCESSLGAENCAAAAQFFSTSVVLWQSLSLQNGALSSWMLPGAGCFMESWVGRGEAVLLCALAECT